MPRRTIGQWFRKYFLEGQALRSSQTEALENLDPNAPWYKKVLVKHRRIVGVLIPFTLIHFVWWSAAIANNFFQYFPKRYPMTITMIFGGIVAGMTSEGGGAVAFPVMTLAFNIAPSIARDFSMMIQGTGMSCATFAILWMRIQLEYRAIIFCLSGAFFGIILGLEFIDPNLTPPQKKMAFVSIWFSFAFALFLLNRYHKRKTFKIIPDFRPWKAAALVFTGFLGGIFTSVAGSGLDICSFSILTLLFRVSEKTATPTSVVLMAANSLLGVYWRQVIMHEVDPEAWKYLAVCGEIVVLAAPTGSVLGSHFHRQVLAACIYIIDTVSLIGAFAIVKLTPALIGVSIAFIVFGFMFFGFLSYAGQRLLNNLSEEADKVEEEPSVSDDTPDVEKNPTTGTNNQAYVASDEKAEEAHREMAAVPVNETTSRSNLKADFDKRNGNTSTYL